MVPRLRSKRPNLWPGDAPNRAAPNRAAPNRAAPVRAAPVRATPVRRSGTRGFAGERLRPIPDQLRVPDQLSSDGVKSSSPLSDWANNASS